MQMISPNIKDFDFSSVKNIFWVLVLVNIYFFACGFFFIHI